MCCVLLSLQSREQAFVSDCSPPFLLHPLNCTTGSWWSNPGWAEIQSSKTNNRLNMKLFQTPTWYCSTRKEGLTHDPPLHRQKGFQIQSQSEQCGIMSKSQLLENPWKGVLEWQSYMVREKLCLWERKMTNSLPPHLQLDQNKMIKVTKLSNSHVSTNLPEKLENSCD